MNFSTPHLEKLKAAIENDKTPDADKKALRAALGVYKNWIKNLNKVKGSKEKVVSKLVALLNNYKFFIDYNLIFESEGDFLYRQKGQLKLDNTVIEEFIPFLVNKAFPQLTGFTLGPTKCFSALSFNSSLTVSKPGGGILVKTKDQDFAIAKKLFLKTSHFVNFKTSEETSLFLGYITAECKTNLDKTMFQEAAATAIDVKSAVLGAKYFLICEWLDMTPRSTATTAIDEVLILRKAKRLPSNIRKNYSFASERNQRKKEYSDFLQKNPFNEDVFLRFINHIETIIDDKDPIEDDVLKDGFF